jgi:hypothetical protein
MRVNEVEEKILTIHSFPSIRGLDPFRFNDWKTYRWNYRTGYYGDWTFAVREEAISDQYILWSFFGYSGKKIGDFSRISKPQLDELLKRSVQTNLTTEDLKLGHLYAQWLRGVTNTREKLAPLIIEQSRKVSKRFRTAKGVLHRGIHMSAAALAKLKAGQAVQLRDTLLSSWTTSYDTAQVFTKGYGVVISKQFSPTEIIVNFGAIDDEMTVPSDFMAGEREILVNGNGIGKFLDPKKEKLRGFKFTSRDWGEGKVKDFPVPNPS